MSSYIEHQQSVIGCIFLEPSCIDVISQVVRASDFDERHSVIYQSCLDVSHAGGLPDFVTVSKDFSDETKSYLMELVDCVPHTVNAKTYAESVADFGQRRNIGNILSIGIEKLKEGENPTAWVETQLSNIRGKAEDVKHIKTVLSDTWKEIENIAQHGIAKGYKTGISELDEMGIFQDGDFVVIAGRPGMGKSVLGAQLLNENEPSLIFTYEMMNNQLCKRMLAKEAKINLKTVRSGQFKEAQYSKVGMAVEALANNEVYFCEASKLSIHDLRAKARIMVKKHGIKKIVVDYIQLCYDETKSSSREQEVSSVARNLKLMAQELNVCVIGLAQLNRKLEERQNKRPMMADLRESGAIEQDADAVLFLYRDYIYNQNAPERDAEIIVGKFRNGETGYITCLFIGEHQVFASEYKGA